MLKHSRIGAVTVSSTTQEINPATGSPADTHRYDNCYATSNTTMVDSDSAEAKSPSRFQKMASSLANVDRDFQFFVCQWGIGEDVGDW